jgi:hypothetical protein
MRVALFLLALVALFAVALGAGTAIGPAPADTTEPPAHDGAMAMGGEHGDDGSAHAEAAVPHGLAATEGGLRLAVATPELVRGRAQTLRFRILDAHDRPVHDFDRTHERRMHAIVVRHDLTGFQHLHPRLAADGTWSVPLRIDAPGSYRLYADFSHDGEARTLSSDLRVDGTANLLPLPAPASRAVSDGGDVVRLDAGRSRAGEETTLRFAVERNSEPIALAPYLGAGGHLVALREGDLAFLHVHPVGGAATEGRVAFDVTFPSAGRHRLFLQYRTGAQVRTAAFTLEVAP